MLTKQRSVDMCSGGVVRPMLMFALPIMLTGILQLLYNAADIIVVGNFSSDGNAAIAAVSSTGSLTNLLVNLFIGISVGSGVVISQRYGARDNKGVFEGVQTAAVLAIGSGLLIGAVGFFAARPLLELMGTPSDVIELSTVYLKIYFLGTPGNMVYNFLSSVLRSVGDSRRPLIFLASSGLINVVLNMVFCVCFDMSVAGVALATIISQYLSAAMVGICLIRSSAPYRLTLSKLRVYGCAGQMLRIGIPTGLQSCMFSLSNVLIQSSINQFGTVAMAANGAAASIEGFVYIAMNSFSQAAITFTGQNYGAGKINRLGRVCRAGLLLTTVVGAVLGIAVNVFGQPLLSLYDSDPTVCEVGSIRLAFICLPYFLCGIMEVFSSMLRGIGYSVTSMVVSVLGACVFRVAWLATVFRVWHALESVYMSYPVSWLLVLTANGIIFATVYRRLKQKYKTNQTEDVTNG